MVTTVTKCALTIAIVASIACCAYGIRCYNCESTLDSRCSENFDESSALLVDCDKFLQQRQRPSLFGPFYNVNATGCMKRLFEYLPSQPRIQRSCFYGDIRLKDQGCQVDANLPSTRLLSCDVCTKDSCNGSSSLTATALGVVLFFVLARFLA